MMGMSTALLSCQKVTHTIGLGKGKGIQTSPTAGYGTCFHIKNCFLVVFVCLLDCFFFPPRNLGPISLGLRNGNLWSILKVICAASQDLGSLNQLFLKSGIYELFIRIAESTYHMLIQVFLKYQRNFR